MSEPPVVFGDGKAVAGAHQGAREGLFQSHVPVTRPAPGSVVPAVTNAGCTSPSEGDVGPGAAAHSVGGRKQWGEGRQLLAPAVTAKVGGPCCVIGGDTCVALPLKSCCGRNRIVRRAVSSAKASGRGSWSAVLSWCRSQPQCRPTVMARQEWERSSEAEGGGWMDGAGMG